MFPLCEPSKRFRAWVGGRGAGIQHPEPSEAREFRRLLRHPTGAGRRERPARIGGHPFLLFCASKTLLDSTHWKCWSSVLKWFGISPLQNMYKSWIPISPPFYFHFFQGTWEFLHPFVPFKNCQTENNPFSFVPASIFHRVNNVMPPTVIYLARPYFNPQSASRPRSAAAGRGAAQQLASPGPFYCSGPPFPSTFRGQPAQVVLS